MAGIDTKEMKGKFHWPLFGVTILLSLVGLMTLYSATFVLGQKGLPSLFITQVISFSLGFFALFIFFLVDYRFLEKGSYFFYGFSLLMLILVLLVGKTVSGSKSWIMLGPITLQPSEFAKLAFIFALARFFGEESRPEGYNLRSLLIPFLLLLFPLTLILLQKDIGSSFFFVLIFGSFLFFAGIKKKTILLLILVGITASGFFYAKFLNNHQKARIQTFFHPKIDPQGEGYHLIQSKITVGSGKFFGRGYLKGMHNKLLYLPEKHTDFIFPVLAEEWGFVGSFLLFLLYATLVFYGMDVSMKARDPFGVCLAFGIVSLIFWQLVVNLSGVLGLIPLTGVTLPLLSYGGSSVVTILAGIGLLLNIWMRRFIF